MAQLESYYDEDEEHRLQWIKSSFYSSLFIGISALLPIYFQSYLYYLFIIIYTAFYVYVSCRFIRYPITMNFPIPAITQTELSGITPPIPIDDSILDKEEHINLKNPEINQLKRSIDKWLAEKKYCQKDVSVDETAKQLGTNRKFLQYYFRNHMPADFRSWRIELRILEAKRLLRKYPDYTIKQVYETAGFNEIVPI